MDKVHKVCEFLKSVEEEHPIPAHADLFTNWAEDVRELWNTTVEDHTVELDTVLEDILDFREKHHRKSLLHSQDNHLLDSQDTTKQKGWEWLLTTKQVEQRTDAWIAEARDILTASEIGVLWKGPGTRAALVKKKAAPPAPYVAQQAVRRNATGPMDWGVRYEPIVKEILEKELKVKIVDLGRIRHRTVERLGASPDGLIVEGPDLYVGKLVEIKCPPTRIINDTIPFEYWCQMQLQMEICERPACEYVEVKFKEMDAEKVNPNAQTKGWITLLANTDTLLHKYVYSNTNPLNEEYTEKNDESWVCIETYGWEMEHMRRTVVLRDQNWFASIQSDIQKFWEDVEACRAGTWNAPESKRKKKQQPEQKCCIQDEESNSNLTNPLFLSPIQEESILPISNEEV